MKDYSVDQCYMVEATENEGRLDFTSRVIQVTNTTRYHTHRSWTGQSPYSSPQFQHPEFYFWAVGDKLRLLGSHAEFNMASLDNINLQKIHQVLGPGWNTEALSEVYSHLKYQRFSQYYQFLLEFKWKSKLTVFPLFDHYEQIQMVAGKLMGCFRSPAPIQKDGEERTDFSWALLNEDNMNREIRKWGGEDNAGIRLKKKLVQALHTLHRNDKYARFDISIDATTAAYREGALEYIPTQERARFYPDQISLAPYAVTLGRLFRVPVCSDTLVNTLARLTEQSLEKLDLLAEMLARVFCAGLPSKYIWHICGNSAEFIRWLEDLTDKMGSHSVYAKTQDKQLEQLAYDQVSNRLIQYNKDNLSEKEFAALNHSQMKAYLEGGKIAEIDNCYQVDNAIIYNPVIIFASRGNEIEPCQAFKKLPWREICVPDMWKAGRLTLEDRQWLKTSFIARGMQLIYVSEKVSRDSSQADLEQIVHKFTKEYCEQGSDLRTDCKTFYSRLKDYIAALPFDVKLGGSTTTCQNIACWMKWTSKADRKNRNRLAFEGVAINDEKLNAAIEENQGRKKQAEQERMKQGFREELVRISELVSWPI